MRKLIRVVLITLGGLVALFIIIGIIGAVTSSGKKSTPSASKPAATVVADVAPSTTTASTTTTAAVSTTTAASTTTTAAPVTTTQPPTTTAPPTTTLSPTTAAPAGCSPISDEGTCYEPGEYCRDDDHGLSGTAGDGEAITCEDNDGWRWEPS